MFNLTPEETLLALWRGSAEKEKKAELTFSAREPSLIDAKVAVRKGFVYTFFGRDIMSDIIKEDFRLYDAENGFGAAISAFVEYIEGKEEFLN